MLQPQVPLLPRKLVLMFAFALMVRSLSHSMGILRFAMKGLFGIRITGTGAILNMKRNFEYETMHCCQVMVNNCQFPPAAISSVAVIAVVVAVVLAILFFCKRTSGNRSNNLERIKERSWQQKRTIQLLFPKYIKFRLNGTVCHLYGYSVLSLRLGACG